MYCPRFLINEHLFRHYGGFSRCPSIRGRISAEIHEPAVRFKKVVSSMAAGDAFNAGYLAALLKGLDDAQALRLANLAGAGATLAWGRTWVSRTGTRFRPTFPVRA